MSIAVKEKEDVLVVEQNTTGGLNENKEGYLGKSAYKLKKRQKVYLFFKSVIDWLVAFVLVFGLLPIWVILGIAIKCESRGPAVFKQNRFGKKRKIFKCYKWRSMPVTAKNDVASKEAAYGCNVTKIGKVLRKFSIDEFAQLLNVLMGKMSLVGYRPIMDIEKEIDEYRFESGVYQLKPGITGWAQVNGRVMIGDKEKGALDEYYLKHVSLWLDLKIVFLTIKNVVCHTDTKENCSCDK